MRPPAGAFEDTTHDWEGGGCGGVAGPVGGRGVAGAAVAAR